MTVAAWLELVGGLLLVLGLSTRPVARTGFISSFIPLPLSFLRHGALPARRVRAPGSLYPIKNHGELVVLCFVFLYPAVAGGGRLSVDAMWRR